MTDRADGAVVEDFRPTSGRIMGGLALAMAALVVVVAIVDPGGLPGPVVAGALFFGTLAWATMLRPRLWVTERDLVMRNAVSTTRIPLASIEQVAVRQVCAVSAGEKRYVSPAVGKSWRQSLLSDKARKKHDTPPYAAFVEERLHAHAEQARLREGVALLSDEQLALASGVRREWAWPEIVALGVTGVALLGTIVV